MTDLVEALRRSVGVDGYLKLAVKEIEYLLSENARLRAELENLRPPTEVPDCVSCKWARVYEAGEPCPSCLDDHAEGRYPFWEKAEDD